MATPHRHSTRGIASLECSTGRGGYLKDYAYDWRKHKVPPKQVERANPLQFMLLDAAGQAIDEAGGIGAGIAPERTSVLVGTVFGGEFGHQLQMGLRLVELRKDLESTLAKENVPSSLREEILASFEERFLQANPALLDETGSFTSSTLASRITKQYNLMGGAMAIDAGDGSSMAALASSVDLLLSGASDAVICAAGQRAMDLAAFETLASKGWFSGSIPRVPAEGVVVLVLKRLEDAVRDDNPIHAVIDSVTLAESRHHAPVATSQLVHCVGDLQGAGGLLAVLESTLRPEDACKQTLHLKCSTTQNCQITIRPYSRRASEGTGISDSTFPIQEKTSVGSSIDEVSMTKNGSSFNSIRRNESKNLSQNRRNSHSSLTDVGFGIGSKPNSILTKSRTSHRSNVVAFPGQGSQSPRMLDRWLASHPLAYQSLAAADRLLARLGSQDFRTLAASQDRGSWNVQATMLIADVVLWEVARSLHWKVDTVTGHSLGELAALVACEAWDLEQALLFVQHRSKAVDLCNEPRGALLSVRADCATIEETLRSFLLLFLSRT